MSHGKAGMRWVSPTGKPMAALCQCQPGSQQIGLDIPAYRKYITTCSSALGAASAGAKRIDQHLPRYPSGTGRRPLVEVFCRCGVLRDERHRWMIQAKAAVHGRAATNLIRSGVNATALPVAQAGRLGIPHHGGHQTMLDTEKLRPTASKSMNTLFQRNRRSRR